MRDKVQEPKPEGTYTVSTGFVFLFNLIVGAGALTVPHAFAKAGIFLGTLVLAILCFVSYVAATFVVESMAGVIFLENLKQSQKSDIQRSNSKRRETMEVLPLLDVEQDEVPRVSIHNKSYFEISRKVEMATMAEELFGRQGLIAFYLVVVIYLFGDLAIYAVAVPKSCRELICPDPGGGVRDWPCLGTTSTRVYQCLVLAFSFSLGAFFFGKVEKTKLLQFCTTVMRYLAFALMIVIAAVGTLQGSGPEVHFAVSSANFAALPTIFGVCIYSFMCHHSIPGIITPITNKGKLYGMMSGVFWVILAVYLILSYTALFRFEADDIMDVYTLNFKDFHVTAVGLFLTLFPVFTLSSNFPLIGITLRENLRTLMSSRATDDVQEETDTEDELDNSGRAPLLRDGNNCMADISAAERIGYPLAALVPPIVIALCTEDVAFLVGFTGSYAGLGIQWVIPACLVYKVRQDLERVGREEFGQSRVLSMKKPFYRLNPYVSPFASPLWVTLLLAWSALSVIVVTFTHILNNPHPKDS